VACASDKHRSSALYVPEQAFDRSFLPFVTPLAILAGIGAGSALLHRLSCLAVVVASSQYRLRSWNMAVEESCSV
jgi:hypothetical protein